MLRASGLTRRLKLTRTSVIRLLAALERFSYVERCPDVGYRIGLRAFEVGTLDEVFRARAWLRERGVPMVFEGRRRAGCQVAIEFRDPDDNNLEIYWNIDQIGTNSTARPASEWRQAKSLEDAVKDPVAGQRLPRSAEVR